MRILLLFFISFYSISAISQIRLFRGREKEPFLVAKNVKHSRWYHEDKPLKITYTDSNGNIVKAKGRLVINDSINIELHRFNGRRVSVINPDNIISIERWSGPDWISAGIVAGVGTLIGVPTFIALGKGNNNLALLAPALLTFAIGAFLFYDVPIIIASKLLSVRSQKNGYSYYIDYN